MANLYVSTSYVETFSNSELNALSCGTRVQVTKKQGIQDIIEDAETGFTLREETPEVFAKTLLKPVLEKNELESRRE